MLKYDLDFILAGLLGTICGILLLIMFLMFFTSCNFSVNLVHTSGIAEDVGEEKQTDSPDITATVPLVE